MLQSNIEIYLASSSPRRQELLQQIAVNFELLPVNIDESCLENESAEDCVQRLALAKANVAWQVLSKKDKPVLAADTIVVLDEKILGKPASKQQAREMLRLLSGNTHQVYSAVAVCFGAQQKVVLSKTSVGFRNLTEREIVAYCDTQEPYDKAGAYGIQGLAAIFITNIKGSYSGVMGLPLFETKLLLDEFTL